MNKYIFLPVLSLLALGFFFITKNGMENAEASVTLLYDEHVLLLEQLSLDPTNEKNLTAGFAERISLSDDEQSSIERSVKMQHIVDVLTFSIPHCLSDPNSDVCKVHSEDLISSAKRRHAKILLLKGAESQRENILSAEPYTTRDLGRSAFLLVLEGLAITSLILWIASER